MKLKETELALYMKFNMTANYFQKFVSKCRRTKLFACRKSRGHVGSMALSGAVLAVGHLRHSLKHFF